MDIQSVASQLVGYLGNNPDLIAQFVQHPYSTTATATGSDERISKTDMSQIVTQVAAQSAGQSLGAGDIAGIASSLLGDNGGSVHALTSALFGGTGNASGAGNAGNELGGIAELAAKSVLGGLASRGAASLITSAMGLGKPAKK